MKLIVLKKSIIITVLAIIFAIVAIGVCAGALAVTAFKSEGDRVIVIDAGHGGIDAGVVGRVTDVKESDINLAIAKQLKSYFSEAGFTVVMTRTSNGGLYGLPNSGFKMRDMKKRKQIIEESSADMVISVHQNSCPLETRRGGQVFYNPDSECGKALADCIQSSLNNMKECVKKSSALAGDYYMLKCTESPSVIVECGFLTNGEDEKLLSSPEYQKSVAYAIFKGAVSYYG
ncbi:MAG: N-acetylmuramoyl-L-alanine amidase [Clostridiales bacterium]|nr:N-acetylmuramoyl-L-alanine amidase [Clostridiales bacterium]